MESTLLLWGLGLLAVALLLVVVDLFVPTMGVLAITALLVAIAGVACLFRYDTVWGVVGSLLVVVGGPVLGFIALQLMPHTPFGRRLVLGNPDPADEGDRSEGGAAGPSPNELLAMIGREGVVVSDLRPVGVVRIGDQRYDALAEFSLIRAGSSVVVTQIVDGQQLKVRAKG